jgi:hypothetical protein
MTSHTLTREVDVQGWEMFFEETVELVETEVETWHVGEEEGAEEVAFH